MCLRGIERCLHRSGKHHANAYQKETAADGWWDDRNRHHNDAHPNQAACRSSAAILDKIHILIGSVHFCADRMSKINIYWRRGSIFGAAHNARRKWVHFLPPWPVHVACLPSSSLLSLSRRRQDDAIAAPSRHNDESCVAGVRSQRWRYAVPSGGDNWLSHNAVSLVNSVGLCRGMVQTETGSKRIRSKCQACHFSHSKLKLSSAVELSGRVLTVGYRKRRGRRLPIS